MPRPMHQRLREAADNLDSQILSKHAPMTQNPTPKRNRQYNARMWEGNNLQRCQKAMRALADLWEQDAVPPLLDGLKTRKDILPLVSTGLWTGGYYECGDSNEYRDTSPAGRLLQSLIDGRPANSEQQELERMLQEVQFANWPGFFPTPEGLALRLVIEAEIKPGDKVLEPSAGIGSIAAVIRQETGISPDCCEIVPKLADILLHRRFVVIRGDFLTIEMGRYDVIVMNPPFEKNADIDHVRRAYELLTPGGRLVSVMSSGSLRADGKRKVQEFMQWCDEVEADFDELPEDSFSGAKAFRQTGVRTVRVLIHKPAAARSLPRPMQQLQLF